MEGGKSEVRDTRRSLEGGQGKAMEMEGIRLPAQGMGFRSDSFFSHPQPQPKEFPTSLSPALVFVGLIIAKTHELCGDEGGSDASCVLRQPGVMSQGSGGSGLKNWLCY